jgi:tellurite resistance protein
MLDDRQKRAFIALACKVAWADGVVADEERKQVAAMLQRLGGTPITPEELDAWLTSGAPAAELSELPEAVAEMFIYEAMRLVESDGEMADSEMRLIEDLLGRVRNRHEDATTLAKIALAKKPARDAR